MGKTVVGTARRRTDSSGTRLVARFNRLFFNPVATLVAGRRLLPIWAVLRHRGRRSGRLYRTPVAVVAASEGLIVPLPFGVTTDWCRNVRSAGGCVVRWKGGDHPMERPEIIGADQALPAFPAVLRFVARAFGIRRYLYLRHAPVRGD